MITDHKSDLHEYFENNQEVMTYKNKEELLTCVKDLKNDPNLALSLAVKAQSKILMKFNTENQISNLAEILNQRTNNN